MERDRLPSGTQKLDAEDDYFTRQNEFRVWLREEKGKYVDEISGEKSRSYFKKFVKAWNLGELKASFYNGEAFKETTSASNTAYRWSFTAKRSRADEAALESAKKAVSQATYAGSSKDLAANHPTRQAKAARIGPTLPSAADRLLQLEETREGEERDIAASRKREREDERERIEDVVGPREVGREGQLEKKRLKRENDRQSREKDEGGPEVDEGTLYGDKDSFRARVAARDAARQRMDEKKRASRPERSNQTDERISAIREKDKMMMEHFHALAKERFG